MKKAPPDAALSRRERQVMDILFRRGEATVAEIMAELPDPPTYSAVRSILRILGEKRLINYREDGPRYVYLPAVDTENARDDASLATRCAPAREGDVAARRRPRRGRVAPPLDRRHAPPDLAHHARRPARVAAVGPRHSARHSGPSSGDVGRWTFDIGRWTFDVGRSNSDD